MNTYKRACLQIVTVTYQAICHQMNKTDNTIYTYDKPWFFFMAALETVTAGGLPTIIVRR